MQPLHFSQSTAGAPKLRVVLLHGLGGESSIWDELRQQLELALPIETVAFDLAGQGQSSRDVPAKELTVISQANIISQQLGALEPLPTVVIGHCYGSLVALALAEQLENLQQLVLISTGSQLPILGWLAQGSLASVCTRVCVSVSRVLPRAHIRSRRDFSSDIDSGQFSIKRIMTDIAHTSLTTYPVLLWEAARFPAADYLKSITVRTQVFQGDADTIFPVKKLLNIVAKNPYIQLEILPEAHHVVVLQTQRQELFAKIEALCRAAL